MPATAKAKNPDALLDTFKALKKIYEPYSSKMNVTVNDETQYYLESRRPMYKGKAMCFGAVRMGKGNVSFHLMALYCFPEMKKKISPELKKRMQGKQCFRFSRVAPELFKELAELVEEGADRFSAIKDFERHVKNQKCE